MVRLVPISYLPARRSLGLSFLDLKQIFRETDEIRDFVVLLTKKHERLCLALSNVTNCGLVFELNGHFGTLAVGKGEANLSGVV